MATVQVLPPSPRPGASYVRKRRHSVSAPPPGFQLPFPHAPKPVLPLVAPSAVTATAVPPRKRVSTAPLSPQARPAALGQSSTSRTNIQRRLATYGEQGVAAASLATLEVACTAESGIPNIVKKVTLDEKSALRKKQRTFSPSAGDVSSSDSKPSMWATRTFPFHRARSGSDPTRKRLGIPSFGWPKPVAASTLSPMTSDSTMEDSDGDSDHILVPSPSRRRTGLMTIAENSDDNSSAVSSTLRTHRHPVSSDAENPREVPLRCQPTATKSQSTWKPMPKPPVRLSRKKLPSPPLSEVSPPPRLSSPLGPERRLLPPRPRFPRSMNSRSSSELRFGKDGMRIPSLGERGAAADMYRRVLLRSAHFAARKRELARLAKIAAQANPEEVYVLRLSDDVKGGVVVVAESTKHKQEKLDNRMDIVEKQEEEEQSEKMDVDTPECGDIELLPDIPDMDFEEDHKMVSASPC